MFRAHHLHDDRLFDCYLAELSGETPDPRAADHLADCSDCSGRYAELSRFMDALRSEGRSEGDEIFTADRLRAQQQAIARRIEHIGRPARVISFPGGSTARTIASKTSRVAPRWVAAAAAAGIFVGAALGTSYEWTRGVSSGFGRAAASGFGRTPTHARAMTEPVATRGSDQADVASDEAFLSELEIALDRPRTPELRAYDALTPHFKEIKDVR
jgi:anti-sigma factor RsiW